MLSAGALLGVAGVVLGAWGAHGLTQYLGTSDTGAWPTAVLYHLLHAVMVVVCGLLALSQGTRWIRFAGVAFVVGIVLFSGSLYALTLGGPRWLGPVTPLGGVSFILAWSALCVGAWRCR